MATDDDVEANRVSFCLSNNRSSVSHKRPLSCNQKAALDGLRFRKTVRQDTPGVLPPLSTPMNASPHLTYSLPTQSRDASTAFRFIPPSTTPIGTVLVPNSSPSSSDNQHHQHLHYQDSSFHEMPVSVGPSQRTSWNQPNQPPHTDPLLASSGFVDSSKPNHASFTRNPVGDTRKLLDMDEQADDGPPRKRINRGDQPPHAGVTNGAMLAPDSPEVQRLGHRRSATVGSSSDDSMLDARQSPLDLPVPSARPRIVRGQRPGSLQPTVQKDVPHFKDAFAVFRISNIEKDLNHLRAAWDQALGDSKKATELLHDPSWRPSPSLHDSDSPMKLPETRTETGRVAEVDEATKASRAALKEKAKKSSIYANRTVLDTTQTTPRPSSSITHVASPLSPSTPPINPPRRKRLKQVLLSESEHSASDDDEHSRSSSPPASSTEQSAFDYINTANSEALQELTGESLTLWL